MYLIFATEQEAWDRSEQEGIARGLAYHKVGKGTRYVSSPKLTLNDNYALPVSSYNLTEEEQAVVLDEYTPKPVEEI